MAKIAVVFLLVALVAVCNGARLRREESTLPALPALPEELQPVINEIKKLGSEENLNKLKAEADKLVKTWGENGNKAVKDALAWVSNFQKEVEEKFNANTAPKA